MTDLGRRMYEHLCAEKETLRDALEVSRSELDSHTIRGKLQFCNSLIALYDVDDD